MFKDILKQLRNKRGLTQEDLACALGVTPGTIGNYEQGQRLPKDDKMWIKIAQYFNVTVDYLMDVPEQPIILAADTGSINGEPLIFHETPKHPNVSTASVVDLPVLNDVATGIGSYAGISNLAIDYTSIPSSWLSSGADYFILRIDSDSMEPEICDGDYALIRHQSDVNSGSIGVVLIDNHTCVIKKIMKYENYISLISFNKNYESRIFVGEDMNRLRFFGIVTKIIRDY